MNYVVPGMTDLARCRVLPPGEFSGMFSETLPVCSGSFMTIGVIIFEYIISHAHSGRAGYISCRSRLVCQGKSQLQIQEYLCFIIATRIHSSLVQ